MAEAKVIYYTEAMCPWCWGAEPLVSYIKGKYGEQISWELRTGGLYDHLEADFDPPNRVKEVDYEDRRERWDELSETIDMPLNPEVYRDDPPGQPNSGCLAIKAAQRQGEEAGEKMARLVREGTFIWGVNMARESNLLKAVRQIGLDEDRFLEDLHSPEVERDFERDWQGARETLPGADDVKKAGEHTRYAYPAFEIYGPDGAEEVVSFLDPGEERILEEKLRAVVSDIKPEPALKLEDLFDVADTWTLREAALVIGQDRREAATYLQGLADKGVIEVLDLEGQPFYYRNRHLCSEG